MSEKNPVGRPTKYKEEYCQMMVEYFDKEPFETITKEVATASGRTTTIEHVIACELPQFERFAFNIGVNIDTLHEWKKVHKTFSEAYALCKGIQKSIIANHAMRGDYNAGFAKFMLINNHGMKEKIENEVQVADINVTFTKDE